MQLIKGGLSYLKVLNKFMSLCHNYNDIDDFYVSTTTWVVKNMPLILIAQLNKVHS